jgi:hypothetical protein
MKEERGKAAIHILNHEPEREPLIVASELQDGIVQFAQGVR